MLKVSGGRASVVTSPVPFVMLRTSVDTALMPAAAISDLGNPMALGLIANLLATT